MSRAATLYSGGVQQPSRTSLTSVSHHSALTCPNDFDRPSVHSLQQAITAEGWDGHESIPIGKLWWPTELRPAQADDIVARNVAELVRPPAGRQGRSSKALTAPPNWSTARGPPRHHNRRRANGQSVRPVTRARHRGRRSPRRPKPITTAAQGTLAMVTICARLTLCLV